ncbi:hypothetical protein F4604DRAFT_46859 [Suillus subluteus]|nr:hypothetical protein F4604DRAFT_46859 [Suillus subluteus]
MKLRHYFNLADHLQDAHESAIDNFSAKILEKLGYDTKKHIIFTQLPLPLHVCGDNRMTKINVSVLANDGRVLLIQENKIRNNLHNPLPQVVAEAIAAYNKNIEIFKSSRKPYRNWSITIPAITMHDPSATFYKIKVTSRLAKAVRNGTYPTIQTTIRRHVPVLHVTTVHAGMRNSRNRDHIIACLNAFKTCVDN